MTEWTVEKELLPPDWQLLKVCDIKSDDARAIITGPFGSNISSQFFVESGVPVIRGNNLSLDMTRFIDDGFVFVTSEKADELNTWAERGDIVFTAAGTLGQVGIIENHSKYAKYVISNKQMRLRVNKNIVRPLFAFYWFSNPRMKKYIQQLNTGSTIPLINLSILRNLPIVVPPLTEQDAIVEMLDSIDSKIKIDQQTNEVLERIGHILFKHWFVDFEFPNEEGKPYKSSGGKLVYNEEIESVIPEDWSVSSLGDILSLLKDGTHTPPRRVNSGLKFIAGATDVKHFEIDFSKCTYITQGDYATIHKYWKVAANDVLLTIVGTVGNVALVKEEDLPFSLQRSIAVLRAGDKISYLFLYSLLNSWSFKQFLLSRVNPTAQPGVYLGTLSGFKVCIPPKEMIDKFNRLLEPAIIKMQTNNQESHILMHIRDALLPKLMSGKIRVPVPKENVEA